MALVLPRLGREAFLAATLFAVPAAAFAQQSPQAPPAPGTPDGPQQGEPTGGRMMMRAPWMRSLAITKPISFKQYQTAALAWFDEADANHDGVLTADERRAWMETHLPGAVNGARRRFPGAGGNPAPPSLTRADFQSRLQEQFDAIDTNHDGTITPDEMQAAAQRRSHYRQLQ